MAKQIVCISSLDHDHEHWFTVGGGFQHQALRDAADVFVAYLRTTGIEPIQLHIETWPQVGDDYRRRWREMGAA